MSINLCIIEDKEDFELITKEIDLEKSFFLPVNLETYLECVQNNLKVINFEKYVKNNFHESALLESKRFIDEIKFINKIEYSLESEIKAILRFRLHSMMFLIQLIECSIKDLKVKNIVISGLIKNTHFLHNSKLCTEIVKNLYENMSQIILPINKNNEETKIHEYQVNNIPKNNNQKIFMSNYGYNFSKIANKLKIIKNIDCWVPFFKEVSILRKAYYKLFKNINIISFKKNLKKEIKKKEFIFPISFKYNQSHDLSDILNLFTKKLEFYFNDLNQKIIAIKDFIKKNNYFNLTLSNISRGLDGAILDKDILLPSMCISHGIICKSLNKYDEIYKKIIAEGVFNGDSKYFSIQSKTMNDSLKTHQIKGIKVITGNLVFANNRSKKNKKKYFLYASTIKDFSNLHFLGVEMFYEYFHSLKDLDSIAKKYKENIYVKPHPSISPLTYKLKRIFKNLKFSNAKIDKLLENAIGLISYSSTSIEDALNSQIPVILYDPKKRYKHIEKKGSNTESDPINYITLKDELIKTMMYFRENRIFNFDDYVYNISFEESIKKHLIPLIN